MKNHWINSLFLLCIGLFSCAHATVPKVFTLSIGPGFTSPGEDQILTLTPDVPYAYYADKSSSTLGFVSLFGGIEKRNDEGHFLGQFGLELLGATNVNLNGDAWIDADPDFNDFFYSYKINHSHIALKGRLLSNAPYTERKGIASYLSASVGIGFNYAYDFSMQKRIYEAVIPPLFDAHTKTSFIYAFGIGLEKALNQQWRFSVGYEFADWGSSALSKAEGQSTSYGLTLNHLFMNNILFGMSYAIS